MFSLAPDRVTVGIASTPVGVGLDAQVGEHIVGGKHIAVLHVWHEDGCRILGILHVEFQALCHDAFCNVVEHLSAHAASRCRQARFLDAHDAAVARIVGWEVAGEAYQIVGSAALVAAGTL